MSINNKNDQWFIKTLHLKLNLKILTLNPFILRFEWKQAIQKILKKFCALFLKINTTIYYDQSSCILVTIKRITLFHDKLAPKPPPESPASAH